jgi:hypothetical protein
MASSTLIWHHQVLNIWHHRVDLGHVIGWKFPFLCLIVPRALCQLYSAVRCCEWMAQDENCRPLIH